MSEKMDIAKQNRKDPKDSCKVAEELNSFVIREASG
jgi:hypothetical protein